jgi:predicted transcriptional regulator
MTKTERFTFRLSPTERTALESYANQTHKTESRVLREALANILVPANDNDTRIWQNRSSYRW